MSVQSLRHDTTLLTDAELVARAAAGDAFAVRLIMERNNGRLYRVARGVVRDDSEAEDILQEAYMRAFSKLGTFRGEASLATWLTRIVLNEALGRLRRRRPTDGLEMLDGNARPAAEVVWLPGAASDVDPERAAARRQVASLIERAIDALPEAFRIVFVMRAVEEMSVEETSAALGIPEATVKTRLHRARRLLRDLIQENIGSAVADAFPFAGRRCARTADAVLARLGLMQMPPGD